MTPEQVVAERRITALCHQLTVVRSSIMHIADKNAEVAKIEAEIRELKKITGPRTITGSASFGQKGN